MLLSSEDDAFFNLLIFFPFLIVDFAVLFSPVPVPVPVPVPFPFPFPFLIVDFIGLFPFFIFSPLSITFGI